MHVQPSGLERRPHIIDLTGTAERLDEISKLVIPNITCIAGLCAFLAAHRITESFGVAIERRANASSTVSNPARGAALHSRLLSGGLVAEIDSGVQSMPGRYAGETIHITNERKNPSGGGSFRYSLRIPTVSGTHALCTEIVPPETWHASMSIGGEERYAYNPDHPDWYNGRPYDLAVVALDAAYDLAAAVRTR